MPISHDQYSSVMRHVAKGLTAPVIAEKTGLSVHTVNNVLYGRVKKPGARRADAGISLIAGMNDLVREVRNEYISQSRRKGNLKSCIDTAKTRMLMEGRACAALTCDLSTVYRHVTHAMKVEKWTELWEQKKMKHLHNKRLPRLHYDYWKLGLRFMDFVVMDGRKADQWRYINDAGTWRMIQPKTFMIMDLLTRSWLYAGAKEKDFASKEVMAIILRVVQEYGRPGLAWLCDNGMEQVATDNILAMEAMWLPEEIQAYRSKAIPEFGRWFPGEISPVVTSFPRIPDAIGKGAIESGFAFIQRRMDAMTAGDAYQGGGREDVIHRTFERTPHPIKSIHTFDAYVNDLAWFFTATEPTERGLLPYACIERPHMLRSFAEDTGLAPTVANIMDHEMQTFLPHSIPPEQYFRVAYYSLNRLEGKRIDRYGQINFQYEKRRRQLWCELDYTWYGERVDIVFDPNDDTKAALFHEGRFLCTALDIAEGMHQGRYTPGSAREAARAARNRQNAIIVEDSAKLKERVHTTPVQEEVVVFDHPIVIQPTEKPLYLTEADYEEELSTDAQRFLDSL